MPPPIKTPRTSLSAVSPLEENLQVSQLPLEALSALISETSLPLSRLTDEELDYINEIASRWGVDLSGGGGYRKNRSLDDITQTGLNVGGRAGVRFPLSNLDAGLGVSGYFGKNTVDFPEEFIRQGAPERISNIDKRLTGVDASLGFPGGERFSVDYRNLSPKDKELMFRFKMPF